jgi:GNAT superfamily N-acetyltransferase
VDLGPAANPDAVVEHRRGEFLVSTDRNRLDLDLIYQFLTNCYWAKGIPKDVVARSIEHSLCFGIYDGSREKSPRLAQAARHGAPASAQIGFARVISDFTTYAYIADVFVLESHRGQGIGKLLMECIQQHPQLQGLRRWSLTTADAHGLYSQFGFAPLKWPERYMEILRLNLYENT